MASLAAEVATADVAAEVEDPPAVLPSSELHAVIVRAAAMAMPATIPRLVLRSFNCSSFAIECAVGSALLTMRHSFSLFENEQEGLGRFGAEQVPGQLGPSLRRPRPCHNGAYIDFHPLTWVFVTTRSLLSKNIANQPTRRKMVIRFFHRTTRGLGKPSSRIQVAGGC